MIDLLVRIGQGDESALRELQIRTGSQLACGIRRIVRDHGHTEEVLQDVYTYVWLHAREYRGDRGTPVSWLSMLARSRALDRFRKLRREGVTSEFDDRTRNRVASGPPREADDIWQHSHLRAGVRELTPELRYLISLAFYDGFSHSEIAAKTSLPLGTVKSRIRVALFQLRERMREEKNHAQAA
jgi:RNA polymerase sigma-70 factor, ECF subfamily